MDHDLMRARLAEYFQRTSAFHDAELDAASICLEQWDNQRGQLLPAEFAQQVRYARDLARTETQDVIDVAQACITEPVGAFIAIALVAHNLTDAEIEEELRPRPTARMNWLQRVLASFWGQFA